jgi:hypothetical protein
MVLSHRGHVNTARSEVYSFQKERSFGIILQVDMVVLHGHIKARVTNNGIKKS